MVVVEVVNDNLDSGRHGFETRPTFVLGHGVDGHIAAHGRLAVQTLPRRNTRRDERRRAMVTEKTRLR